MENEIVMEYARKLGNVLRETDTLKNAAEAEKAYRAKEDLQAKITEYFANQKAASQTTDEEIGVVIRRRLDELLAEIEADPVYDAYMQAQIAVRELMGAVNDEIQFAVSGERPCSPDKCASCGGGCHAQ